MLRSSLSLLLFPCFVLRFLGRWFGLCEKLPEAVEPALHKTAALGHPIGATGAILIGSMVDELERRGAKRGLVTMCAGGGMAPAIIIERV